MPEKRGLLLECLLLVLGGWAGHPDDARAKGFGIGICFHVVVHWWVGIRTMPETQGLEVEYFLLVLGG